MKKQLLALAMLTAGLSQAQTWSENFSSTTAPGLPTGWLQNNVDGLTVYSGLSSYNFGINAWVSRDFATLGLPTYGKAVASTSYYTPAGVANDWLITPSFTVPANSVIEWEALASNANYPDGYVVKISTTGTLTTDFSTTLLTVGSENTSFTLRSANLNAYTGQTVRLAFINNSNDKELLLMDNFRVFVPAANDGVVESITGLTRYMAGAGSQIITGKFKSNGYTPVTNASLSYKVNSGAVVTQTVTFSTALNYGDEATYSFTTPANLVLGSDNIKVWVSNVNGTAETVFTNDTSKAFVYVASQSVLRNALIEEFSSSTCVPCANLNVNFDPLLNTNNPNSGGRVNVVKYQVNWPSPGNDPSYNPHGASRVTYYGIDAAPTALTNGKTEMVSHDQSEIDAAKAEPAYATITASITATGNVINASATVIPFVSIPTNSPLRLHQVILEKFYDYAGAVTTQKTYHHIMRKMSPSAAGAPVTSTDGTPMSASFTHTATSVATPLQNSYDFWNTSNVVYEYVVFLQDEVSNDILQSGSAMVSGPVGVVELKDNQQIGVYPNPAKDYAVVGIKLNNSSDVTITIYDITGKMVYSNNAAKVNSGKNEITINTTDFATGTYNVIVTTEAGVLNDKLIISK